MGHCCIINCQRIILNTNKLSTTESTEDTEKNRKMRVSRLCVLCVLCGEN